jgi:hypothetical protein
MRQLSFYFVVVVALVPVRPSGSLSSEPPSANAPRADEAGDKRQRNVSCQFRTFEERRTAFRESTAAERVAYWRDLVGAKTPIILKNLSSDSHDGIALCAGWERSRQIMLAAHICGGGIGDRSMPARATGMFHGLVEGRLKVIPPEAWSEACLRARLYDTGSLWIPAHDAANILNPAEQESDGEGAFPAGVESRTLVSQFHLKDSPATASIHSSAKHAGGTIHCVLPSRVVDLANDESIDIPTQLSAIYIEGPKKVVVAVWRDMADSCVLVCFDGTGSKSGNAAPKILWERTIESRWDVLWKGNVWLVELRTDGERVFVFTTTHDALGIEGIQSRDGRLDFSFTTLAGQ